MGLVGWIVLGLVVGALVKNIMPGRVNSGWFASLALGVAGAVVGGCICSLLFHAGLVGLFNLRTWVLSILSAVIVAGVYGAIRQRRLNR